MKDYKISLLADYYGGMLADRALDTLRKYYDEDMSLSEIAEFYKISRQAISETLSKSAQTLKECEERLRLCEKAEQMEKGLNDAITACESGESDRAVLLLTDLKQQL